LDTRSTIKTSGERVHVALTNLLFLALDRGSPSATIRLFAQTDYLAFSQIELFGKTASILNEPSFEFSRRQQATDGVDVL
jgi:hypothetical protein